MIIKFPTALYRPLLPLRPEDVGNITFTISSNDPPRPTATGLPLQLGGSRRPLPPRPSSPEDRRVKLGDFIFTVAEGTQVEVNDGKKLYEVGQYLEFDNNAPDSEILDQLFPDVVDLQHNTNYLDYAAAGLTQEEVDSLTTQARKAFNDAIEDLNNLRSDINSLKARIKDSQAQQNEIRKIKTSALLVFTGSDQSIVAKLNLKEEELVIQENQLIEMLNSTITLATAKYNQIIGLKEVVR
jgi:hypothetical protein